MAMRLQSAGLTGGEASSCATHRKRNAGHARECNNEGRSRRRRPWRMQQAMQLPRVLHWKTRTSPAGRCCCEGRFSMCFGSAAKRGSGERPQAGGEEECLEGAGRANSEAAFLSSARSPSARLEK